LESKERKKWVNKIKATNDNKKILRVEGPNKCKQPNLLLYSIHIGFFLKKKNLA